MSQKFTSDWFSHHIPDWERWLHELKNLPHLDFLEVGVYEGRSVIWLLENILTDKSSKITCIDSFIDPEYDAANIISLKEQFSRNVFKYRDQITLFHKTSFEALQELNKIENKFDFIYIDGCHKAQSVLEDGVLAFRLLKNNAVMIFDDFNWNVKENIHDVPRLAISAFMSVYSNQIKILYVGDQLVIRKL